MPVPAALWQAKHRPKAGVTRMLCRSNSKQVLSSLNRVIPVNKAGATALCSDLVRGRAQFIPQSALLSAKELRNGIIGDMCGSHCQANNPDIRSLQKQCSSISGERPWRTISHRRMLVEHVHLA